MQVPPWMAFLVAAAVSIFGLYRLRLAWRSAEQRQSAEKRGGLYALPRRTHVLFGVLYLLLGVYLLLSGLGYRLSPF